MELIHTSDSWALRDRGRELLAHSPSSPCLFLGRGAPSLAMYRGNFSISDYLEERVPLRTCEVSKEGETLSVSFGPVAGSTGQLRLTLSLSGSRAVVAFHGDPHGMNRLWLRLRASEDERVWGCGEQMSYFNLRGRNFPLWTSEPGVGRDKSTHITWQADVTGKAGGDYYTTNYPQPTFVSSHRYCVHADTTAYADFDFRNPFFHELQFWEIPKAIEVFSAPSFVKLAGRVAARFGTQPRLPQWVYRGAVLGLKRGRDHAERVLDLSRRADMRISALWCEDWAGTRQTSFGKRLFWDWKWNPTQYPDHQQWVASLNARGFRFLAYVNPYLCSDGVLFAEAAGLGYLAKNRQGCDYLVDFGEFYGGVVDFTNPKAAHWFSQRIIGKEMIEAGIDGWMADFGEYLPIDVCLSDGSDPMLMHNAWPELWARVNADAVRSSGRSADLTFFMRAGYTGVQAQCPMIWAGDQSVDFSRHDGLQTVICAALSSGLMGNAYHHSDIGGYTSLFGNCRTPELFQRWAEMAAFTPFMRTHESNRPTENFQFWEDSAVLAHFARMTRVYVALGAHLRRLEDQATGLGLPLQRPLFMHFEEDPACYDIQDEYLYGEDLLVAPVHAAGRTSWEPYLPAGAGWIHLWSGTHYQGGARVEVPAPLGQPPVFVRKGCAYESELLSLGRI